MPTFGNPHDLIELSYPPPREQVAESLLVVPKRPRPRPKATRTQDAALDAEEILEHEVFPWLLRGNVWVLGNHRLVMAFLEVFGSAASPDNWEGRGLAPVGLDKYLELSLELKLPKPLYLLFIIPYEEQRPNGLIVGMMASFEPYTGVPAHLYWQKLPEACRHEFNLDHKADIVGALSMLKSRHDEAQAKEVVVVESVTLKGRQP